MTKGTRGIMNRKATLLLVSALLIECIDGRLGHFQHRKLADIPVEHAIGGEYIIHLHREAEMASVKALLGKDVIFERQFGIFHGIHLRDVDQGSLHRLLESDGVRFVEPNQLISTGETIVERGDIEEVQLTSVFETSRSGRHLQGKVQKTTLNDVINLYNLDRVDQNSLPLNGEYVYAADGSGTDVYVIDSGIRLSHVDFEGRATCGWSYYGDECDDVYGHGTHVAGIIGGRVVGIAKKANLIAVKATGDDGTGSAAAVIASIEWAMKDILASGRPSVINMSIEFRAVVQSVDAAIRQCTSDGIPFVVAAGNSNKNACTISPASSAAISVGATDESDVRWAASNVGGCVTLFAPGRLVVSTYNRSDRDATKLSGTSMAAPHVAGAIALLLDYYPSATHYQAKQFLLSSASKDKLVDVQNGSPNLLLHIEAPVGQLAAEPETTAPTSAPTNAKTTITKKCRKLKRRQICTKHRDCCSERCVRVSRTKRRCQ